MITSYTSALYNYHSILLYTIVNYWTLPNTDWPPGYHCFCSGRSWAAWSWSVQWVLHCSCESLWCAPGEAHPHFHRNMERSKLAITTQKLWQLFISCT